MITEHPEKKEEKKRESLCEAHAYLTFRDLSGEDRRISS